MKSKAKYLPCLSYFCLAGFCIAWLGLQLSEHKAVAQDTISDTISILEEAPPAVIASRDTDDDKLLQIVATVAVSQQLGEGAQADDVKAKTQALLDRMDKMPLRKWYVLRQVKQELRAEGL